MVSNQAVCSAPSVFPAKKKQQKKNRRSEVAVMLITKLKRPIFREFSVTALGCLKILIFDRFRL